jgi:large subunit ribosomal protein L10e
VVKEPVQLRDNSIEAARQAANKYLEKNLVDNYFLQVVSYPHLVTREHAALGVAGADRISKGMKRAFGKPKGRMARLSKGEAVFRARIMSKDLRVLKEALRRAECKLSGSFQLVARNITADAVNLARSVIGRKMKKREEEEPVAEAAAEAAPAAEAGKEAEAKAEATPAAGKKK